MELISKGRFVTVVNPWTVVVFCKDRYIFGNEGPIERTLRQFVELGCRFKSTIIPIVQHILGQFFFHGE